MDNFTISCIFLKILDIYQTINSSFSAIMSTEAISVSKSWQSFSLLSVNTQKISFFSEEIIKERPWPNILTLSSNVILISNKVLKNMTPIFIKDFFNSSVSYHFALLLTKNTSVYMEAYLPISKKSVIFYLKKKNNSKKLTDSNKSKIQDLSVTYYGAILLTQMFLYGKKIKYGPVLMYSVANKLKNLSLKIKSKWSSEGIRYKWKVSLIKWVILEKN